MNREYPCDIIIDLLPGYIDGILSETGTNVVKEHLDECDDCRQSYNAMTEKMQEEVCVGIIPEEQAVLDGFKKVHQLTKKLKLAVGIVTGLLTVCLTAFLVKVYVIGSPLSVGQMEITNLSYDEETGKLVLHGTVFSSAYRVSRVVFKESNDEDSVINVLVYAAETLPFLSSKQGQRQFTVSIPNAKGCVVYLASVGYDRLEIYNWKHSHYDKLAEMEEEIYDRILELDREQDALGYYKGIDIVDGTEGISYCVDTMIGDDSYYWWFNDQLVMHGDFANLELDIWISLEEPYQIKVFDYRTGQYSEDFSVIADRKSTAEPEELKWLPEEQ